MSNPTNTDLFLTKKIVSSPARIANADGTGLVTILAAQASGCFVNSLIATSTDSVARTLVLYLSQGGVDYPIGAVSIPAGAGTDVTNASVDILASAGLSGLPLDANLKKQLWLDDATTLKAAVLVAVTSTKFINLLPMAQAL